jgi:hemoglobin
MNDRREALAAQTSLDEAMIERLVRRFYATARQDPLIGPMFDHVHDWERHIARITAFWSSVALMSGRYSGQPMQAHFPLGLRPEHFARWLELWAETARAECPPEGADLLIERARRIARSLEYGIQAHAGILPEPRRA